MLTYAIMMHRKRFLQILSSLPALCMVQHLSALEKITTALPLSDEMPVLFLGHGSPMNAIEDNAFVAGFRQIGTRIQPPRAILCISAHWETRGTFVTAMEHPRTIHDFGGFPQALFDVQYPAPGSRALAREVQELVTTTDVGSDHQWGLDHGAWSVIKHLYPRADVPVIQMSIDSTQPAAYHYALAQQLSALRNRGVLIIGSGNMVHNLRLVAWNKLQEPDYGFDWALEARADMVRRIVDGDHQPLVDFKKQGPAYKLAIPTPEHYLPLLYVLGLQNRGELPLVFNDQAVGGSLTMTSVAFGLL